MCCGIVQLLDACTTRLDLSSAARRLFSLDGDEVCFVLLFVFLGSLFEQYTFTSCSKVAVSFISKYKIA